MNEKPKKPELTRRQFLKASALAGAVIGMGDRFFAGSAPRVLKKLGDTLATPQGEWKAAYCSGCHQPTCAIKVRIRDGVIAEVMGDPESPTNRGALCPRGLSLAMNQYNPYRVKTPLKRTNPKRGLDQDPGWVEISWEEALSIAAEKLKAIRDSEPKGLLWQSGFGREEEEIGFSKAFGATSMPKNGTFCPEHFAAVHLTGTSLDRLDLERNNYVVFVGGTRGGGFVISDSSRHFTDAVARGMKVVNVDPHYNNASRAGEWAPIRPGTETAFGLALLHTIIHEIGVYDEWWLKVRSNGPYLVPIEETYIKGTRVYTEDYVRDPETNKPLVWDVEKKAAVPFDDSKGESYALTGTYEVNGQTVQPCFQALKDYVTDFTAEWASEITTLPAAQIRGIAENLVKEARIGSTIEIDGVKFPYRPAAVDIRRAAAGHRLGTEAYKSLIAVNVLLGNSDVPGGIGGTSTSIEPDGFFPYLQPDEDGIQMPTSGKSNQAMGGKFSFPPDLGLASYYPHNQGTGHYTWKAIVDPEKYHVEIEAKGMVVHGSNPILDGCNYRYVMQGIQKLDFIMSVAYHLDETTQMADIIFPEDSPLEATSAYRMFRNEKESIDATRGLYMTLVKHNLIPRLYDTRSVNDVLIELADRIGMREDLYADIGKNLMKGDNTGFKEENQLDPKTLYTWEEILELKLKNDFGKDTTYADFEEHSFKHESLPDIAQTYNYYSIPDNGVRLPIYFHRLPRNWKKLKKDLGEAKVEIPNQDMEDVSRHYSALPIWYEPPNYGTIEGYPLYAVQWKDHFTNQNTLDRVGNAWIQDVIDQWAPRSRSIVLSPKVAKENGIETGDEIWVESTDGGKTKGVVLVSNLIHPECVGLPGNYGKIGLDVNPWAKRGAHFNVLMSPEEKDHDPVECSLELAPRVKIYKA
jgi:anaerobic selenocysteine-containing dehydrogenase